MLSQRLYVKEFLPQPAWRGMRVESVGFGVHNRAAIAVVILPRDRGPSEDFAGRLGGASGHDYLFVALVKIIPHHDAFAEPVGHEPSVLITGHSAIKKA